MAKRYALSLLALAPGLALAQSGPSTERVRCAEGLEASCGGQLSIRWSEQGTPARLAFSEALPLAGDDPARAAAEWLERDLAPLFEDGVRVATDAELAPRSGPNLVLTQVRDLGRGRVRVDFAQRAGAVDVQAAGVSVELAQTAAGLVPVTVRARYRPGVPADMGQDGPMPGDAMLAETFAPVQVGELTLVPESTRQIVDTAAGPRLANVVVAGMPGTAETWEVALDATTGEELSRVKLTCSATAQGLAYAKNPGETPRTAFPLTDLYVYSGNNRVTTNANGQHNLVGMVSLDEGLSGPLLRVFVSNQEELTYSGPADINLRPSEDEPAQDELAAWNNVHRFNAHLRATYPRFANSNSINTRFAMLVRYTQNGRPLANAFYSPGRVQAGGDTFRAGYIAMGTFGRREAARSASVCQHEYCHALFGQIVNLSGTLEAGGLNEGLSDYLPAAFNDDPRLGAWLTNGSIRDLRENYVWPRDNNGGVHRVGHIFAGALWDAREAAEAKSPGDEARIDQAVAEGIFRLQNRPDLIDAREAILDGDGAVNGGAFRVTLARAFNEHGIGPAPDNDAPGFVGLTPQTVRVGESLVLAIQTTDPDGDPVNVTASRLPNASYDPASGEWTFTPDAGQQGSVQVTFTASDEELTTSETLTVDVDPPAPGAPQTPIATTNPASTAPVGSAGTGLVPPSSGGGGGCSLGDGAPAGGPVAFLALLVVLAVARRQA